MKMHGKYRDESDETRKTSEIQAVKTSEHQARTIQDDQDEVSDNEDNNELFDDEDKKLLEELNWGESDDKSAKIDKGPSSQGKIKMVMPVLLQNQQRFKTHFQPREISVGPIHACNSKTFKRKFKIKLAKIFIKKSGKEPARFLEVIKKRIAVLKMCFDVRVINRKHISYKKNKKKKKRKCQSDNSLARLLFLDGCAVLEFILTSYLFHQFEEFEINTTQATFIKQDLFLLENQIPFEVLTLLMGVIDMGKEKEKKPSIPYKACIIKFVHENNICATTSTSHYHFSSIDYRKMIEALDEIQPVHLLDLLRKVSIFGSVKDARELPSHGYDPPKKRFLSLDCFRRKEPALLRDVLLVLEKSQRIEERSLRNVQEFKSSGITIKLSNSRSLKSVSFNTHFFGIFGYLKLPALSVDYSTVRKFLNLVAYETCLDNSERYYSVTSYLNFLDFLVDTEQDVKDLRTACILRNALGSDEEVAELFNVIGLTYLPRCDEDHFEKINSAIEKHCASKRKTWIAWICTVYIRNPWRALSPLLAPLALLFTVVQTWFAFKPRE